ncbi:MAG: cyclic nucleotide-binding domain-containing protein [Spirochaetales bacterium]|nr:cyclic nucleotide-binding domain-containing protein [Spirochaetales bacterium]
MKIVENKEKYMDWIKRIHIFSFLPEDEVTKLIERCALQVYEENEIVISQGEVNQDFYAVVDGSVQVSVTEETGNDVYISTIGGREVFGEAGIFMKMKRTANITSLGQTVILRAPRKEIFEMIKKNPVSGNKFLLMIIHSLLRKLREANQELAYERKMDSDQGDIDALVKEFSL